MTLRRHFKLKKRMKITVYAASSGQLGHAYIDAAQSLGRLIAAKGYTLINGAGRMGLMGASCDACLAAGGEALGIIPRFMVEQGWQHPSQPLLITADMHERKEKLAGLSDACIALPGGVGTLEELMEIITWKQLGLYLKPVIILNTCGYYDPLLAQLDRAADERFMREGHKAIWRVAATPEDAILLAETTPLWDKSVQKFAALT